ncbi:MAG: methyltransferase [Magnetococcales bacterium]|nr:methyltransferase [Magnetococcales bacterium]
MDEVIRTDLNDGIHHIIRHKKTSGKVLDFGCGLGFLLQILKSNGYSVSGVEISKIAIEYNRKNGIPVFSEIGDIGGSTFDIVSAIDVIEHMESPMDFLRSLIQLLSPQGFIFIRLPVINGALFLKDRPEEWKFVYSPYHLHMFSTTSLRYIAGKLGLKVEIIQDPKLHATFSGYLIQKGISMPRMRHNPIVPPWIYAKYLFARSRYKKMFGSDAVFAFLSR